MRVKRVRYDKSEQHQTEAEAYYISSWADVELVAQAAGRHWAVENELHWSLDVGRQRQTR